MDRVVDNQDQQTHKPTIKTNKSEPTILPLSNKFCHEVNNFNKV